MIPFLTHRLNDHEGERSPDTAYHLDDRDDQRSPTSQLSDESSDSDELEESSERKRRSSLRISPSTLANALEINGIHDSNFLDSVLLNDFLTDLVQKEYVWQLDKYDIKRFNADVKKRIADNFEGVIPKEINKEVLIKSLPTEKNFLLQIGHKVRSSSFIKFWQNYDVDCSGYIETKELKLLVQDYARMDGQNFSENQLTAAIESLMNDLDTNKDGKIELEEVSKLMNVEENFMKSFCGRQHLCRKDFNKIFSHYDTDAENCLEKSEVMALINDILKHLETSGKNVPIPLLQSTYDQVMKICDVDNNNRIQKRELALLFSCFE